MDVTEIRIKMAGGARSKLRAYCSVTFDNCFVVRDMKIIEGNNGLFVAMPSRKLADSCPACGGKNHLRARFCNDCGGELAQDRAERDSNGRVQLHADVAHPIHSAYREELQGAVLEAYQAERAGEHNSPPQARQDDYPDGDSDFEESDEHAPQAENTSASPNGDSTDGPREDSQPDSGTPPESPGGNHPFGDGIL